MSDFSNIPTRKEFELTKDMLDTLSNFLKENSIRSNSSTGQLMNKLEIELQNVAIKHLKNSSR
ncbi:hypothetical protein GCM10011573_36530 [Enterococcus wangshanyuanii]|uniref:Uncharacterized protein n=1 Tax=Enterococcus wangshanyuanii TaxID=2005703 RepID=A0ABQ1PU30_9ENTE|nr:hypothetical protein GCM10011573_36530 [Enterococcus wangshanyuanii]